MAARGRPATGSTTSRAPHTWPLPASSSGRSISAFRLLRDRGEPADKPTALIMPGTADDNLTPDMAANFAVAYTRAGGSISFPKFDGQPHAFIARDPAAPAAVRALGLIADFIRHQTR